MAGQCSGKRATTAAVGSGINANSGRGAEVWGGRGAHVLYAPEDLVIDREKSVVAQGETPKKKKC